MTDYRVLIFANGLRVLVDECWLPAGVYSTINVSANSLNAIPDAAVIALIEKIKKSDGVELGSGKFVYAQVKEVYGVEEKKEAEGFSLYRATYADRMRSVLNYYFSKTRSCLGFRYSIMRPMRMRGS